MRRSEGVGSRPCRYGLEEKSFRHVLVASEHWRIGYGVEGLQTWYIISQHVGGPCKNS